jgi:hypothetical protein
MSSHAASLQRPSASPIDVHAAPVQDTRTRSGRGGTALVLGILALICSPIPGFGLILGIFAVTKGAAAAADLRRSGQGGRGRAIAGEVMGVLAIAVSIALPIVFGFLL